MIEVDGFIISRRNDGWLIAQEIFTRDKYMALTEEALLELLYDASKPDECCNCGGDLEEINKGTSLRLIKCSFCGKELVWKEHTLLDHKIYGWDELDE